MAQRKNIKRVTLIEGSWLIAVTVLYQINVWTMLTSERGEVYWILGWPMRVYPAEMGALISH